MKLLLLAVIFMLTSHVPGQVIGPPLPEQTKTPQVETAPSAIKIPANPGQINPIRVLAGASQLMGSSQQSTSDSADEPGLSVALNIMILLTVITLVPSIMLMTTCFVRILIVLALLRQAMGAQSLPPPQVVTGLAMFMTLIVMSPTIDRIWNEAVIPYQNGEIRDYDEVWVAARQPIRDYMFDQIEATGNWGSVYTILNYRGVDTSVPEEMTRSDVDMVTLIPAYMLSELKVGFLLGFRVYLPFLVIDMVIASLLISMSMMMLPPVLISLPFKLLLFVLVDGWTLVVSSLLETFVQDGMSARMSAQAAVMPAAFLIFMIRRPRCKIIDLREKHAI